MSSESEHLWCDARVPVCSCGKRWTRVSRYSNGDKIYSSEDTFLKYRMFYGTPAPGHLEPFELCQYCGRDEDCGMTCHGTRACEDCFREADASEEYE